MNTNDHLFANCITIQAGLPSGTFPWGLRLLSESYYLKIRPLYFWWKTTFGEIQPSVGDIPLVGDDPQWKIAFGGRQLLMEDYLWRKKTELLNWKAS